MATLTLPPDLEAWAKAEVAAGRGASVDAVVERALREGRDLLDHHRVLVAEAYVQLRHGELVDEEAADAFIDALAG